MEAVLDFVLNVLVQLAAAAGAEHTTFEPYWPIVLLIAISCFALPKQQRRRMLLLGCSVATAATGIAMLIQNYYFLIEAKLPSGVALLAAACLMPIANEEKPASAPRVIARMILIACIVLALRVGIEPVFYAAIKAKHSVAFLFAFLLTVFVGLLVGALLLLLIRRDLTPPLILLVCAVFAWRGSQLVLANTSLPHPVTEVALSLGLDAEGLVKALSAVVALAVPAVRWVLLKSRERLRTKNIATRGDAIIAAAERASAGAILNGAQLFAVKWQRFARNTAISAGAFLALFHGHYLGVLLQSDLAANAITLCMTAVAIAAVVAYLVSLPLAQRQRNAALRSLYSTESGMPGAFFLYLRSFEHARSSLLGRLTYHASNFFPIFRAILSHRYDVEEQLAEALQPHGLLLAIGDRRISYGAAKLTTGEDWKSDFAVLASSARLIFFAPAATTNVLWEMQQVLSEPLAQKTIWLMPANQSQKAWSQIADGCHANFGVTLPTYTREGCFFSLGANKRAQDIKTLTDFIKDLERGGGTLRISLAVA